MGKTLALRDYLKAFSINRLGENQGKLIDGWINNKKEYWARPEELRKIMGYDDIGRINIDVGSIGKKIIDSLNLEISNYIVDQ